MLFIRGQIRGKKTQRTHKIYEKKNSEGEKELKFYNEIFTIKFDYV